MNPESWINSIPRKPRIRAIICDLDDTLCTEFDKPITAGCRLLAQLDRSIEIHYVTARPEASRKGTEAFLLEHRLPGWRNLYFCPSWKSSRDHKTEVMSRLAKEYVVIVSIGDADEDELASRTAGVPFVRVSDANVAQAWTEIAELIRAFLPPGETSRDSRLLIALTSSMEAANVFRSHSLATRFPNPADRGAFHRPHSPSAR